MDGGLPPNSWALVIVAVAVKSSSISNCLSEIKYFILVLKEDGYNWYESK